MAEDFFTLTPALLRWLPALVLIPLPVVSMRRCDVRAAVAIALITLAAVLCVTWYMPYFLAVLFPVLALVWMECLRRIRACVVVGRRADLVFVTYSHPQYVRVSWTFNAADIDGAPVVWARSLSPEQNRRLMSYFHDRNVWTIEADREMRLRKVR
ncbi:MAG: hypothetical protein ACJ74H_08705 [Thermoanaerobaculia bacterium]